MDLSVCPCSISPGYVVLMGIGVVFVGLFVLVLVIGVMGLILRGGRGNKNKEAASAESVTSVPAADTQDIMNTAERQQVVAAVSAAIAVYMGAKDMSGLRIRSIKRI